VITGYGSGQTLKEGPRIITNVLGKQSLARAELKLLPVDAADKTLSHEAAADLLFDGRTVCGIATVSRLRLQSTSCCRSALSWHCPGSELGTMH